MPYFNYRVHVVPAAEASYWQRREFLSAWWSIYAEDRRWTPPAYASLARELQPQHNPHLARLKPLLIHVDALYRTGMRTARQDQPVPLTNILERPLAAAVALRDPRRQDKTGYLALLHIANDPEAVERLLGALADDLRRTGVRRLLASTGLSAYLGSGIQTDAWNTGPVFGAPSNSPYVPELLHNFMRPAQTGTVYRATVPEKSGTPFGPATLQPLDPPRLAADLLPLLAEAVANSSAGFPPPDEAEAAFMLRWLGGEALTGWIAQQDGRPVGFVLLGADSGGVLRQTGGGRRAHRRAWLALRARLRASAPAGRLFFGGVVAERRKQGIGRQLWQAALQAARERGWSEVTVGPVWSAAGSASLTALGAEPVQTAQLFELGL